MEFNERVAVIYGVENAVMLHNLWWWVEKNKANNVHNYEGRYWTYNSYAAFAELFKFWTVRQVQRILENCHNLGALHVAHFAKSGYNRTNWYSVSDDVNAIYVSENLHKPKRVNASTQTGECINPNGLMHTPEPLNALTQTGKCITDINTDINHIVNTDRESALAFLNRELSARYESEFLMKYQTALGPDFEAWQISFNSIAEIECENNKLPWTGNALLARAVSHASAWVRNNKTRAVQYQQNVVPAQTPNRLQLIKRN